MNNNTNKKTIKSKRNEKLELRRHLQPRNFGKNNCGGNSGRSQKNQSQ